MADDENTKFASAVRKRVLESNAVELYNLSF